MENVRCIEKMYSCHVRADIPLLNIVQTNDMGQMFASHN